MAHFHNAHTRSAPVDEFRLSLFEDGLGQGGGAGGEIEDTIVGRTLGGRRILELERGGGGSCRAGNGEAFGRGRREREGIEMRGGNGGFEVVAIGVLKKKRVWGSCGSHGCWRFERNEERLWRI